MASNNRFFMMFIRQPLASVVDVVWIMATIDAYRYLALLLDIVGAEGFFGIVSLKAVWIKKTEAQTPCSLEQEPSTEHVDTMLVLPNMCHFMDESVCRIYFTA